MRGPAPARASQSPLAAATSFAVPRWLLDETVRVLQAAGRDGLEAFVVWGGTIEQEGRHVRFESGLVPEQEGHNTGEGLLVTVSGRSLFDVNRELYSRGQVLAAQIHSHPTGAFHSDTDDCFSLVTLTGALSIVVPAFGRGGSKDLSGWAWYRLTGQGQWSELSRDDKVSIVDGDGDGDG